VTEARLRRRPDALWRRSLDAVVVLPAGADEPVTLGGTGPAVWELLAEWRTVESMVEVLAEAFGAAPQVVEADLRPLLDELVTCGAVQLAADSGGAGQD
jgi:hypothetical protein